jgi:hypothetical protein
LQQDRPRDSENAATIKRNVVGELDEWDVKLEGFRDKANMEVLMGNGYVSKAGRYSSCSNLNKYLGLCYMAARKRSHSQISAAAEEAASVAEIAARQNYTSEDVQQITATKATKAQMTRTKKREQESESKKE